MELFVIPTHRKSVNAIESLIREMELSQLPTEEKIMALVCNGDELIIQEIKNYIREIKKKYNYKIYLITKKDMYEVSHKIAAVIDEECIKMDNLLVPDKIDYGKIYNMIYIVSFILDAKVFHRRDSDCYFFETQKDEQLAISNEEKYIAKRVNATLIKEEISVVDEIHFSDSENILISGSDYVGNWNVDLHELMTANSDVAKKLLEICGIPEDSIDEQVNVNYNNNTTIENKVAVLKSSFKVPYAPECGNMCMTEIHRYIPNFIGENGIGFDYFTYFLGFLFGIPIVFHHNKINHIHDSKRYEDIDFYRYWIGVIKMVDFDLIYTEFIQKHYVEELMGDKRGIEEIKNIFPDKFPNVLDKIVSEIPKELRREKFNSVAKEILIDSNIEKYVQIGEQLINNRETILSSLDKDYKNSIELQRKWRKIVHASGQLKYLRDEWEVK